MGCPGLVCKHLQMSGSGRQECSLKKWNVKRPQELIFGTLLSFTRLFLSPLKTTTKKVCSQDVDFAPGNLTHSGAKSHGLLQMSKTNFKDIYRFVLAGIIVSLTDILTKCRKEK